MSDQIAMLHRLYELFNDRDLDRVLELMEPDVDWANGLDGGHVHGRGSVRDYWRQQWADMDSRAVPLDVALDADGAVVDVHVSARDRTGATLFDQRVPHIFSFRNGRIARFDIG